VTSLISKDANDIISDLSKIPDLIETMNNTEFKSDYFNLIIHVFSKFMNVNSEPCKFLMNSIIKSNFFDKLGKYFKDTSIIVQIIKNGESRIQETIEFFERCLSIFEEFFYKFHSDTKILPVLELKNLIENLQKFPDFVIHFEKLSEESCKLVSELEKRSLQEIEKVIRSHISKKENKQLIPISYKNEKLYLTKEEILENSEPLIEAHRVRGNYESWDRYLNTMFYLVREDCYRSLRKSIIRIYEKNEITKETSKENRDVYSYKNVFIKDIEFGRNGILFTLGFETYQSKISWSKRLLFGSLVVLIVHELNEMVLAIVMEGPDAKKGAQNGKYFCKVSLVDSNFENFYTLVDWRTNNLHFHMIESKAYYESYRHILKRIQELDTRKMPFTDILIECQHVQDKNTKIKGNIVERTPFIPQYFNFHSTLDYNQLKFSIYQEDWPISLTSILDESQLEAFKYGIRNKVAIIQGPPGTGKTFVGALITKLILMNTINPILIVCYTNHALDQFLKHISKYEEKIVRIGGRCKDEDLQKFTLNNIRKNKFIQHDGKIKKLIYEIKNLSNEFKLFCSNFSQQSTFDYGTCKLHFPFLTKRIYDDFKILSKKFLRTKLEKKNVEKSIYIYWIKTNYLEKLLNIFDYNSDNDYYNFFELLYNFLNTNNRLNLDKFVKERQNQVNNIIVEKDKIIDVNDNYYNDEDEDDEDLLENFDRKEMDKYIDNEHEEEGEDEDEDYFIKFRNLDKQAEIIDDELNNLKIEDEGLEDIDTRDEHIIGILNSDLNLWTIPQYLRKEIIAYIKKIYIKEQLVKNDLMKRKIQEFNHLLENKRELENLFDIKYLKQSRIIGMTTTGCAKYSTFLEQLNFETIIVEEAAEVLESHIASILTQNTKHLILIGDHQQLRPNPYNYEICKKYNFDVSLFERLINNEIPYVSLMFQRRMRSEFADFVRLIYTKSNYYDHHDTKNKPEVKGFLSNIFFFNHKNYEQENLNMASKSNIFEASFAGYLAKYLIQQNYNPSQITILTIYVAQVLQIREELKKLGLNKFNNRIDKNGNVVRENNDNVKVVSVDNYQGEENDIIILSLVRSNKENQIGFLKSFNRICVAFSRAKIGFYVFGNFDCIVKGQNNKSENNKYLWTEIIKLANEKKVIDEKFEFKCQKHKITNIVKVPQDFNKIPEGGCNKLCKERLECGHVCEFYCHNFEHRREHCNKPCQRKHTICGHTCTKKCKDDCGNCNYIVRKILPCEHENKTECHKDPLDIFCPIKVEFISPCGHKNKKYCGADEDSIKCQHEVSVILECGHENKKLCFTDINSEICKEPCRQILSCSHICKGTCGQCLNNTLHVPCKNICNKILICSHECKKECSQPCLCERVCENTCKHGYCKSKCLEECKPCIEWCSVRCVHGFCTKTCSEICDFVCNNRCEILMDCNHQCLGLCGEECPKICRICDPKNEAFEIFFGNEDDENALFFKLDCEHVIELSALDTHMGLNSSEYYVHAKTCPKCKTQIKNNNRYFNLIKKNFTLIQKIKKNLIKQYGNHSELLHKAEEIISKNQKIFKIKKEDNYAVNQLYNYTSTLKNESYLAELASAYNLCVLSKEMIKIEKFYRESYNTILVPKEYKNILKRNIEVLKTYFSSRKCYSKEFFMNLKMKISIVYIFVELCLKNTNLKFSKYIILIYQNNFMLKQDELDYLYQHVSRLNQEEIIEIMGISGGRWYTCPEGHLYSVGECGMPMQDTSCPECGHMIGGSNHNPHINNNLFIGFNENN